MLWSQTVLGLVNKGHSLIPYKEGYRAQENTESKCLTFTEFRVDPDSQLGSTHKVVLEPRPQGK